MCTCTFLLVHTHLIFNVLNCASDELPSGHDTHCPQLASDWAHTKLKLNLPTKNMKFKQC